MFTRFLPPVVAVNLPSVQGLAEVWRTHTFLLQSAPALKLLTNHHAAGGDKRKTDRRNKAGLVAVKAG